MDKHKQMEKIAKHRRLTIFLAFIGIAGIIVYFTSILESPLIQFIKPPHFYSRAKAQIKAENLAHQFNIDLKNHKQKISAEINPQLFEYAQYHKKNYKEFPEITVGYWNVIWKKRLTSISNIPNTFSKNITDAQFDFKGNLIGFNISKEDQNLTNNSSLSEDDALMETQYFLESMHVKTRSLIISQKDVNRTGATITYQFKYKEKSNRYPYLTNTYAFQVVGDRITSYQAETVVDPTIVSPRGSDKDTLVGGIFSLITWGLISLILIIRFIRKIKNDELEYKRAVWIGIATAIMIAIMLLSENQFFQTDSLIQAGVLGFFTFLGMLVLFSTAESCTREAWSEKIGLFDLHLQGKFMVRETGTAILRSIFLAGFSIGLLGIMIYINSTLNIGFVIIKEDMLDPISILPKVIHLLTQNLVGTLFTGITLFFFWASYLKNKTNSNKFLFVLLLAITFNLGKLDSMIFHPDYLGFILMFPIAVLWAWCVRHWDTFAMLLSLLWINILFDLMLIFLIPEFLFSIQATILMIFTVFFLGAGLYLIYRKRSVTDYEAYVPEYVNRIAEKERFLKELEIARSVQVKFLPRRIPQLPHLEIVSICQPAMEVGGDYYDFIELDDRYLSVLIGDVSGKGVSAAFYMTMVKGIIKTLSRITIEPATLLAEANEIFWENVPRDVFITIIYGTFDLENHTLTLARAGHNPLIVRKANSGEIVIINPKGIALGLDKGERYRKLIEEITIPIEENDTLVFYTDGVSEAMNSKNECFGEERLNEIIKTYGHLSPQHLMEKVITGVSEFSGKTPQHDDFTMIVIKVRTLTKQGSAD